MSFLLLSLREYSISNPNGNRVHFIISRQQKISNLKRIECICMKWKSLPHTKCVCVRASVLCKTVVVLKNGHYTVSAIRTVEEETKEEEKIEKNRFLLQYTMVLHRTGACMHTHFVCVEIFHFIEIHSTRLRYDFFFSLEIMKCTHNILSAMTTRMTSNFF